MIKNYGFNPNNVIITPKSWKFGSNIPLKVIRQDGQWDDCLPVYECQADRYETNGCVVYGGQNQIETMEKALTSKESNYYEGFNYNLAEIVPPGADPDVVYETFRKQGLIPQRPMPDTLEEFMRPRPMTSEYLKEGLKWLETHSFAHEWIIPSNPLKMKELIVSTLKYSPVGLSVTAWSQDENGLYVDNGMPNSHWVMCYGHRTDKDGRYILKIFDSYDHSKKELHPDHFVSFAKRIHIDIKQPSAKIKLTLWQRFLNWFLKQLSLIKYFNEATTPRFV